MSNAAPVCEIQPVISTAQPAPSSLPAIPVATDLPSALQAIQALTMWVRQARPLLNPQPQQSQGLAKNQQPTSGGWKRVSQQYKTVRVTNPNDPSQYVDVQQIESLIMSHPTTGETWTWSR